MGQCYITRRGKTKSNFKETFYQEGLTGLFDVDSLDINNLIWNNKIQSQNNMQINGGVIEDKALKLSNNQWGKVEISTPPNVLYLVVKQPVLNLNTFAMGYALRSSLNFWYNGNKQNSFFEYASDSTRCYVYSENLNKYHVGAMLYLPNNSTNDNNKINYCFFDGKLIGASPFSNDIPYSGWLSVHSRIGTSEAEYTSTEDCYYKMIAFGNQSNIEEVQENVKFLFNKYCAD